MERKEQVSNATKVETKLGSKDWRLLFGAESPAFYFLLKGGLLLPFATERAGLEDSLGSTSEPSYALVFWTSRVLISRHW